MARKKAVTIGYLTERIILLVSKDTLEKVDEIAKDRLTSRADVVREAILYYLECQEKGQ